MGYEAISLEAWREGLVPTAESVSAHPAQVAVVDGVIAGFYQVLVSTESADLEHLWVLPGSMRQDVGRALLAHALLALAYDGIAILHIEADPNAGAFSVACGAVRVGAQPARLRGQNDRMRPRMQLGTAS